MLNYSFNLFLKLHILIQADGNDISPCSLCKSQAIHKLIFFIWKFTASVKNKLNKFSKEVRPFRQPSG